jgi:DNA adenine methylase
LNHTSFNGLHRVNLNGEYNVPYGNRRITHIPTLDQLQVVSTRLKEVILSEGDFATTSQHVAPGDLVFLDPPYTVAHNLNGFIKYNQRLFSFDDQQRLSCLIDEIRDRGAYYVLTNAAHESIARLFEKGDARYELNRRNSIGGRQAVRGSATEYLFTNVSARNV